MSGTNADAPPAVAPEASPPPPPAQAAANATPAPPSDYGIGAARSAGYSDQEITSYLAKNSILQIDAAKKANYSDTQILDHLSPDSAAKPPPEPESSTAVGITKQIERAPTAIVGKLIEGAGAIGASAGSAVQAAATVPQAFAQRQLDVYDRIDEGHQIDPTADPYSYAGASADDKAALRKQMADDLSTLPKPEDTGLGRAGAAITAGGQAVMGAGEAVTQAGVNAVPMTAEEQARFSVKAVGIISSAVPYVLAGVVGGPGGVAAVAGVEGFGDHYKAAKDAGASDADAAKAAAFGGISSAALTAIPFGQVARAAKLVPDALKGEFLSTIGRLATSSATGVAFSQINQVADNLIAKGTYDPQRDAMQGVGENVGPEATAFALLPGIHAGVEAAKASVEAFSDMGRATTVDEVIAAAGKAVNVPAAAASIEASAPAEGAAVVGRPAPSDLTLPTLNVTPSGTTFEPQQGIPTPGPALRDTGVVAPSEPSATPPVPDGSVRLYHGGNETGPQSNWVTPDLAYAQGYAEKNGGGVSYVDVPQDHPALEKAFDDTGADVKAPIAAFEAPRDIGERLQPYQAAGETPSPAPADAPIAADNATPTPAGTTVGPVRLGYSSGIPIEAAASTPPVIRNTVAQAKRVASAWYDRATAIGGTLVPDFTDRFIDAAEAVAPQTPEGRAIAGDTTITGLVDRLQALRGKPLSLEGAQEIDERLGDLVDSEFGLRGLSKEGRDILNLQTTFRKMIRDATPDDTTGGTEGFEAIKQGRLAWAQAMKMSDLERILNRAEQTDNPVTSIRAGIRTLTSNDARMRGYSPEEVEALKDAAKRGLLGGALHVFGSRLTPLAIGAAGMSGGIIPGLIGAGVAHAATTGLRNLATSIQTGRTSDAMDVLGRGVPAPPEARAATQRAVAAPAEAAAPPPPADLFNRPSAPEADAVVQTQIEREQAAVANMKTRAEQARTPEPASLSPEAVIAQARSGNLYASNSAVTPAGTPVPIRYVVREASDLTPSQTPDGRPNPAFPPELQPRDRTRGASAAQVAHIANTLNPELLGYSADTATGAPVVGPDGMVESGNGRTMAIQRAYAEGSTAADSYRTWLAGQGFDVAGMRQPVLVRERTAPMDMAGRARLADEMGASPTMAMSAPERAAADARRIPTDALSLIGRGDVTSAGNAPFVRAFATHAVPANEASAFMTADGELSMEGATRVRNALTQRAYGDNALVTRLAEDAEPELKAFGGALVDAAGPMAKLRGAIESGSVAEGGDITGAIVEAAGLIQTAKRARISLADAVAQTDAFSQRDPRTEAVLKAAFGSDLSGRMSRPKFAGMLANFAAEMQVQAGLFGEGKTADQVFDEAARK